MFLTSFNNMLAFFMAAFIRIPALRHFAIQVNQFKMLRSSKKQQKQTRFCICIRGREVRAHFKKSGWPNSIERRNVTSRYDGSTISG